MERKGQNEYKSVFSMGQSDMERYTDTFKEADKWGPLYWDDTRNINAARHLFALLKWFYIQIKYLVITKDETDKLLEETEQTIKNVERFRERNIDYSYLIPKLEKQMREFSEKIYVLKQVIGLGIEVEKKLSLKQKWERAARIGS